MLFSPFEVVKRQKGPLGQIAEVKNKKKRFRKVHCISRLTMNQISVKRTKKAGLRYPEINLVGMVLLK